MDREVEVVVVVVVVMEKGFEVEETGGRGESGILLG
jgi:hypothetical protein